MPLLNRVDGRPDGHRGGREDHGGHDADRMHEDAGDQRAESGQAAGHREPRGKHPPLDLVRCAGDLVADEHRVDRR